MNRPLSTFCIERIFRLHVATLVNLDDSVNKIIIIDAYTLGMFFFQ